MPVDHVGVAHAGDAAVAADVGRHPLERHHRAGAGVLGDLGVLGRDHIHDHPALEHLGQPPLHLEGAGGAGARRGGGVSHGLHRIGPGPGRGLACGPDSGDCRPPFRCVTTVVVAGFAELDPGAAGGERDRACRRRGEHGGLRRRRAGPSVASSDLAVGVDERVAAADRDRFRRLRVGGARLVVEELRRPRSAAEIGSPAASTWGSPYSAAHELAERGVPHPTRRDRVHFER